MSAPFFSDMLGPFPDVLWSPDFLTPAEDAELFAYCRDELPWEYKTVHWYGRDVAIPRGLAWFGDVDYTYSGITHPATPLPARLQALKEKVEAEVTALGTPTTFNSVLLNFYRDGNDSIGMHADDERELGRQPVIASVSLGGTRTFVFQNKTNKAIRHVERLPGGSLLVMQGRTQNEWLHGIGKEPGAQPRINLTFRRTAGSR